VPRDPAETTKKGYITLPYVGHVSEAIDCTIHQAGVAVHLRPFNTIRGHLVHPKDKIKKGDKAGLVYQVKCADCSATYVGETERKLTKRIAEHHKSSSPIGHHMSWNKHPFSDDEVSILHQETNWFRRGMAEAIHIHILKLYHIRLQKIFWRVLSLFVVKD